MQLEQLVARARGREARPILVDQGSEHLIPFLGALSEAVTDQPTGPAVRLRAVGTNDMVDTIASVVHDLGPTDTLVLALRAEPQNLPVAAMVQLFVSETLWVLESAPSPARGVGSAIVLTREQGRPLRSHLIGDEVELDDRAVLRLVAERGVEGLAVRAQQALERSRVREQQGTIRRLEAALAAREAELAHARHGLEGGRSRLTARRLVPDAARTMRRRLNRLRASRGRSAPASTKSESSV